jgi:CRISPR-associated protein Cas2
VEILVSYDVSTETAEGRKRLRHVAKTCEAYGQRVQKSVFECIVNAGELEQLKHQLARAIKADEDNVRIYRLREPRERNLDVLGRPLAFDMHDPLVF